MIEETIEAAFNATGNATTKGLHLQKCTRVSDSPDYSPQTKALSIELFQTMKGSHYEAAVWTTGHRPLYKMPHDQ